LGTGLLGTETTFCAAADVVAHVRDDTCRVVVDTPANTTLDLVDSAAVVRAEPGRPVLVDNTFATPDLQYPPAPGPAPAQPSATKYLGGHGDAMGGVVATDATWAAPLRRVRAVTGGVLHPLAGYLLHRGLATLPVRVRAQQESAEKIAGRLTEHPAVTEVFHP